MLFDGRVLADGSASALVANEDVRRHLLGESFEFDVARRPPPERRSSTRSRCGRRLTTRVGRPDEFRAAVEAERAARSWNQEPFQADVISTLRPAGFTSPFFGMCTFSTPLLKSALTLEASTPVGSENDRWNDP